MDRCRRHEIRKLFADFQWSLKSPETRGRIPKLILVLENLDDAEENITFSFAGAQARMELLQARCGPTEGYPRDALRLRPNHSATKDAHRCREPGGRAAA